MLRQFKDVLPFLKHKHIYSSIRGTDITVTPFIKANMNSEYKIIYSHLTSIHYLSPHIKKLSNSYGLKHKKEVIIYQGIKFSKSQVKVADTINIPLKAITISRLHYIKGIEFGILAR